MTDPRDELSSALHQLRGEIRERIPVPAAARLRARAVRRLRVRRTTTALVAAAAVAALVLGGTTLLNATAAPPAPPADTPTPPVTPSPRPAPVTPQPLDDPIVDVDWQHATIFMTSTEAGCPGGPISFTAVSDIVENAIGPADSYPALLLDASRIVFGDLAGDEHPEAVMEVSCVHSEDDLLGGQVTRRLLVVSRDEDGRLNDRGWAGPEAAVYLSWWVTGGRLLVEPHSWIPAEPEQLASSTPYPVPAMPGLLLAYEWEGELGFVGEEPAPDYPAIVPLDPARNTPPVYPRAVASGLGCPEGELRFAADPDGWRLTASAADARYAISIDPDGRGHLFDLDGTGERLLVSDLSCIRDDGSTTSGLAVFERAGDAWQGISLLAPPEGYLEPFTWRVDGDRFVVRWTDGEPPRTEQGTEIGYRWTGTVFEPIDE